MNRILIIFFCFTILLSQGCEDAPPTDYIQLYYVEAYLIVGKPISGIKVMTTESLQDSFKYESSFIKNADVKIKYKDSTYQLVWSDSIPKGYYYPDTAVIIRQKQVYAIEIRMPDGTMITGTTYTPKTIKWINPVPDTLYYPKDTVNMPPTDKNELIKWESLPGALAYIYRIKCLDTLNYGQYLIPKSDETNRRISRPWQRGGGGSDDKETTRWGYVFNNETPVVWTSFKWFGKQEMTVIVPDYNFGRWFLQYSRKQQSDPLLNSVNGAIGVFGSFSEIRKETFLIKNQP